MRLFVATVCVRNTQDDQTIIFHGVADTEFGAVYELDTTTNRTLFLVDKLYGFASELVSKADILDILENSTDGHILLQRLASLPNVVVHTFINAAD